MRNVFVLVLSICLILLWPVASIWSLNTLFDFGIEYSFKTVLATLILLIVISVTTKRSK